MKIYLAGPMRGIKNWNFLAFDEAERCWTNAGHKVFSPAQTCRALGYDVGDDTVTAEHLRHVIMMDSACIYAADAIALLPGWNRSVGATAELALAQFLRLPVYDAVEMSRIEPVHCPWNKVLKQDREYYAFEIQERE